MTMVRKEFVDANSARESMYHFLSKSYELELTSDQIEQMKKRDGPLVNAGALKVLKNQDLARGFTHLRKAIAAMKKGKVEDVQVQLAAEFAGIFLGIRDGVPHPSESAYLSASHLVFQEQRDQVMEAYRKAGLQKEKSFVEPEDHVAAELGFMAYLAGKTAESLKANKVKDALNYTEMQSMFLRDHLTKWIPKFCDDIMSAAKIDYYKGIGLVTRGFISSDVSFVENMMNEFSHTE